MVGSQCTQEGIWPRSSVPVDCGAAGCVFNIQTDPSERHELTASMPALAASLRERLASLIKEQFAPDRGAPDPAACAQARAYGGFYGPWIGL